MSMQLAVVAARRSILLLSSLTLRYCHDPTRLTAQQAKNAAPSDSVRMKKEIETLAGFEGK